MGALESGSGILMGPKGLAPGGTCSAQAVVRELCVWIPSKGKSKPSIRQNSPLNGSP